MATKIEKTFSWKSKSDKKSSRLTKHTLKAAMSQNQSPNPYIL